MRFNLSARGGCDNARGYVIHEPKASALRNRERYRIIRAHYIMKPHRHYVVFSINILVLSCDLQPIRFEVSF